MYFSDLLHNIDYTHFSISLSFLKCKQHKKGSKTCTSYHDLEEALTKRNSSKTRFFKVKTAVFLSSENFDLAYLKNIQISKQCENKKLYNSALSIE